MQEILIQIVLSNLAEVTNLWTLLTTCHSETGCIIIGRIIDEKVNQHVEQEEDLIEESLTSKSCDIHVVITSNDTESVHD